MLRVRYSIFFISVPLLYESDSRLDFSAANAYTIIVIDPDIIRKKD